MTCLQNDLIPRPCLAALEMIILITSGSSTALPLAGMFLKQWTISSLQETIRGTVSSTSRAVILPLDAVALPYPFNDQILFPIDIRDIT